MEYAIPVLEEKQKKDIIAGIQKVLDKEILEYSCPFVPCMALHNILKNDFKAFNHESFEISGWKIDFSWYFYVDKSKLKIVGSMFYGDVRISLEEINEK